MRKLVIAIDGPAGAGKSMASKAIAQHFGYSLLDTGAIYRAVALLGRQAGLSWSDGAALAELARTLDIRFDWDGDRNRVAIGARDVSDEIRQPEIGGGASQVSALPEVRAALLDLQRRLAAPGGVVAEGRDIGSVVLPSADVKFFLTASPQARARRRYEEERARGIDADFDKTLADLMVRDHRDSTRETAPLRQAEGAILIDSTDLSLAQVVAKMIDLIQAYPAITR